MKRILTIIVAITALFALASCKKDPVVGVRAPLDNTYWEGTYGEIDRHWDYKLNFRSDRDCELRIIYYVLEDKEHRLESDLTYSGEYELNGSNGTIRFSNSHDDREASFSWGGDELELHYDGKSVEMHR